jgi:cytochrome c553
VSGRQRLLLTILLLAAGGVLWLALRTRQPPLLPADAAHAPSPEAPACLTCHGPGGPSPRSVNHPLGDDCGRCHGARSAGA